MLGRLRMTVHECIENYVTLLDETWSHPRKFHVPLATQPKYGDRSLCNILKGNSRKFRFGYDVPTIQRRHVSHVRLSLSWRSIPHSVHLYLTKDFSIVMNRYQDTHKILRAYLFRSYHHLKPLGRERSVRNPGPPKNYPIWQVGRAAVATQSYFDPLSLGDNRNDLLDGGLHAVNPTLEACISIQDSANYDHGAMRVVVSIGSGKDHVWGRSKSTFGSFVANIYHAISVLPKFMERETREWARDNGARYFRLDVEDGVFGKISLDTWKGKGDPKH